MDVVVCREQYGSQDVKNKFIKAADGSLVALDESKKLTTISQFFRSVFLPQGYPESVSEDYLEYQIWDTVQAFASSITGTLATHAVLQGVGVGDESATVLAATITWLMKDGTGMLGRILFTWMQGAFLDCDCKRWRFFADILNDFAILLEILAPVFSVYFRFVVCVAGVCKSIVGVAGGATRAALTQHQARRNNMADVSAKDGSQETLVNLSALLCSLVLIPLIADNPGLVWTLYFLFTSLHLFANFRAVTSVCMETFNQARLHILMQRYLSSIDSTILSVKATNICEPVLWKTRRRLEIKLGVSLKYLLNSSQELDELIRLYHDRNYLINVDLKTGHTYVVLHADCNHIDQLQACYHAEVIEFAMNEAVRPSTITSNISLMHIIQAAKDGDISALRKHSCKFTEENFAIFMQRVQHTGWKTTHVQLGSDEWRADWRNPEDKKIY